MREDTITLAHGSGGLESNKLIESLFYRYFGNDELLKKGDSAVLSEMRGKIGTTIDGFVVDPIFFNGGDIGKLSICGTVNDLAVSGALPLYITCSFIIEEGFSINDLEIIVRSMAETADNCDVIIAAGDTKVVERGKGHKIYIITSGIGTFKNRNIMSSSKIREGDKIILSGSIGDHGSCIMSQRENFKVESGIKSDCAPLISLCNDILKSSEQVRMMRDPTRGGLATTLNELVLDSGKDMEILESAIPIKEEVHSFCELLGIDPMYCANEGKLICIVGKEEAEKVLKACRNNPLGREAEIIGEVLGKSERPSLYMKTLLGSVKVLKMARGEILPRIC